MNQPMKELLIRTEGRYFNEVEADQLRAFAGDLLDALEVTRAVELAEAAILDECVARIMEAYPEIAEHHGPRAEAQVRRDQQQVLRYACSSLLMRDPNLIHDKLSVWARTILNAFAPHERLMFGYRALVDAVRNHVSEDQADAILPYLGIHVDEMATHGGLPS